MNNLQELPADTWYSLVINVVILIVSMVVLDKSSELTITHMVKISEVTRIGKTAVGFTLLATSTSLPELAVSVMAG